MRKRILLGLLTIVTATFVGCSNTGENVELSSEQSPSIVKEVEVVESKITTIDIIEKLQKQSSSLHTIFEEFENLDFNDLNSFKIYGMRLDEKCSLFKEEALELKGNDEGLDEVIDIMVSAYDEYVLCGKAMIKAVDDDNVDYILLATEYINSGNKYVNQATEKIKNLNK